MSQKSTGRSFLIWGLGIVLAIRCMAVGQIERPHESQDGNFDCGTLALYHILSLEGRPASLVKIGSHLPRMPPDGYSMKELRDAARACGLYLSGVRLQDPIRELDRPAIVFLKQGHYVVVRPVGHTGKIVQVLDGTESCGMVDKNVLFASPNWSGLVLMRAKTRSEHLIAVAVLSTTGAGFLLWFYPRLRCLCGRWRLRWAKRSERLTPV